MNCLHSYVWRFPVVVNKYLYCKSDRGVLPDISKNYTLNTYPSWPPKDKPIIDKTNQQLLISKRDRTKIR